jgi:hypothetical protein
MARTPDEDRRPRWVIRPEIDIPTGSKRPALAYLLSFFAGASASTTGTSNVAGATFSPFHAANDSLTFALPFAAPSGARTGP